MPSVREVKVPYVSDNATQGGSPTPSESDFTRIVRSEVDGWKPRRGPDWSDLLIRVAGVGPSPWVLYTTASAALVVILVTAYVVCSWLQIGALAPQTVQSHVH
jgi:hypothetical protein